MTRVQTANNTLCIALALGGGGAVNAPAQFQQYWRGMMDEIKSNTLVPDLSLLFQNVFYTAYTLFGAWFWLHEISRIQEPPCSEHAAIILLPYPRRLMANCSRSSCYPIWLILGLCLRLRPWLIPFGGRQRPSAENPVQL